MTEREGLVARIRQIRRSAAAAERGAPPSGGARAVEHDEELVRRIAHLEQLVEGLQDAVHRESERQGRLIGEIQAQIQPAAISAALSKDARERGL